MRKKRSSIYFFVVTMALFASNAYCQTTYKPIPLPTAISSVNEEFSGMTLWNNRVYLEPQYGSHKETLLEGDFNIYSIAADSITRVIAGKDPALTAYRIIKVLNLNQLPDSVKQHYEGFEAITIAHNQVYLSIETTDTYAYCFLLKGTIDTVTNEINIDPNHFITLKRPRYIRNAGFESVTYLPKENKLLALYEFNAAANGNMGYLIDPSFKQAPKSILTPFLYFRITDITATNTGKIYGINYFYNGDYKSYLDNGLVKNPEPNIKQTIPDLRDSLTKNPNYLKTHTYARIIMRDSYKDMQWQQVTSFNGYKNNWEGLTLFNNGALIITDANRSSKQVCLLAFIAFK